MVIIMVIIIIGKALLQKTNRVFFSTILKKEKMKE